MINLVQNDQIVLVDVSIFQKKKKEEIIFRYVGTRSRGSITMRMLMGANDIYADGKVQSMTTNGWDKFYYKF